MWLFPTRVCGVQLPTWLPSKARGAGGRSRHVLPKTGPIWESKSELEEVRARLPVCQGEGNRRNGDPEPRGTQLWPPQELLAWGRRDGGREQLGGDRSPWISWSCPVERWGRRHRGVGLVQEFVAAHFAMFLVGRSPARASGASTQGQGDPSGPLPAWEELLPSPDSRLSPLGKISSFPSLCPQINTPKHRFPSLGFAVAI